MNSSKDILDMIATEAVEGSHVHVFGVGMVQTSPPPERPAKDDGPTVKMSLRLVREKDGSLKWED